MKRFLSLSLAALLAASALASCATAPTTSVSTSSLADEAWLAARLGTVPANVSVGLGSKLGLDMSAFEDDGYIIRTEDGSTVVAAKSAAGLDRAVRAYAKAAEAGRADSLNVTFHEGHRIDRLTIAGRDISDYTVTYEGETDWVIPGYAGTTENNACLAAAELSRLIGVACGADLPVVPADPSVSPAIRVGYVTDGSLGDNGFEYRVDDGDLIINGAPDANGCVNAIYRFLDDECGWSGLIYGDSILAESEHIDVPADLAVSVKPVFNYLIPCRMYDFKYVSERIPQLTTYYGKIMQAAHGMSTNAWGGADAYSQICYTDELNYEAVAWDVHEYLETQKAAGVRVDYVDIGQSDNSFYCTCKNCMKLMKEENGANAGPIVRFANRLAEEMSADFPGVKYSIFAYMGSNECPVTAPSDDIYVTYCTDHACVNHPIDGSGCEDQPLADGGVWNRNGYHAKNLREWCALAPHVYVWHYGMDNAMHQFTQYRTFYRDMCFFRDLGVEGFDYEAESWGLGETRVRLQEMMYFAYHPEWTEDDYNAAVEKIYEREFGDGYGYVLKYTSDIWSPSQMAVGCCSCWNYSDFMYPQQSDIPMLRENADEGLELIEKAIFLASCEAEQSAIERFSLDPLYKTCYSTYFTAVEDGDADALAHLEDVYRIFLDRLARCYGAKQMTMAGAHVFAPTLAEESASWEEFRDILTRR